jgi:hypothetical protein
VSDNESRYSTVQSSNERDDISRSTSWQCSDYGAEIPNSASWRFHRSESTAEISNLSIMAFLRFGSTNTKLSIMAFSQIREQKYASLASWYC